MYDCTRNVSGDVGGGMGRDYMEKEWGITENKKEERQDGIIRTDQKTECKSIYT